MAGRIDLNEPVFCFTSDLDWNPDAAIRTQLDLHARHGAKLTVFATHSSPVLPGDGADVQIGVHPNFLPGSTHGSSIQEVLDHVFGMFPQAQTYRSHSYFDNQQLSEEMSRRGIRYDANLSLYLQEGLRPLRHCHGAWRFPTFFDDNVHWFHGGSWRFADLREKFLTPGLKILNFHPYPIALNIPSKDYYLSKRAIFKTLTAGDVRTHRFDGPGPETFMEELLAFIKPRFATHTLGDLHRGLVEAEAPERAREIAGRPAVSGDYPSSSPEERKQLVREQYDRMDATNIYVTSRDFHLRELEISAIRRHVAGGSVLDCGCGNGYTLLSLGKQISGARMLGVDFSENMIQGANSLRERFGAELKSAPEFVCRDVFEFIREDTETFDFIITERVIVNLPSEASQEEVIRGLVAKLKPGGAYVMVEGSRQGFDLLNRLRAGAGLKEIPDAYPGNESSRKLDEAWIRTLIAGIGSVRVESEENFSFYNLASKIVHPLMVAPDEPKFSAKINAGAAVVQTRLAGERVALPDIGAGKLWVIRKSR